MKKKLILSIGALALGTLTLAGCGSKPVQNSVTNGQPSASNDSSGQSVTDTVKKTLFDFMTTGAGVKCTVQDPTQGQLTMTAKGDKVKVDGFSYTGLNVNPTDAKAQDKGTMMNDGTWVYLWSGKDGMKFNIKDMETLSKQNPSQADTATEKNSMDWKSWVKELDQSGTKYDCNPTVVKDGDFIPPTDVKFQDLGELMKGFMQMGTQLQNSVPSAPNGSNMPNVSN